MRNVILGMAGLAACLMVAGCSRGKGVAETPELHEARIALVDRLAQSGQVTDRRVLDALRAVPRHLFLPDQAQADAYTGEAVAVSNDETLGPVALTATIAQCMNLQPQHHVLLVEPTDPYLVALVARLCKRVTVISMLGERCQAVLDRMAAVGITNVDAHTCDIARGWPGGAPYRTVLLGYETAQVPGPILEQTEKAGLVVQYGGPYARDIRTMTLVEDELTSPRVVSVFSGS
jgi:protein-L-isoaspartate(D-aspartate) O-methyltransferase